MTATMDPQTLSGQGAAVAAAVEADGGDHEAVSRAVLRWAADTFGNKLCLLSSMGDEVLVHLATDEVPGIDVVFLDTGYHFVETLGTRDAFAATRPMNLINITPVLTVPEQDAKYGPKLHDRDPNLCCAMRKVEPLNRALESYDGWISGMRRDDAITRADIGFVEFDTKRSKVKLNPLASWTQPEVDAYIEREHVMLNPLRQIGYTSIGCEPCTAISAVGEDSRAGRWAGSNKTECGLHQ
jgi:phosphoadenosine phosphosulfate reductase